MALGRILQGHFGHSVYFAKVIQVARVKMLLLQFYPLLIKLFENIGIYLEILAIRFFGDPQIRKKIPGPWSFVFI